MQFEEMKIMSGCMWVITAGVSARRKTNTDIYTIASHMLNVYRLGRVLLPDTS